MNNTLQLRVGSAIYSGWTEVSVQMAIDAIAGSFRLQAAPRVSDADASFPLLTGAACEVKIGKHSIISGYIDVTEGVLEATAHNYQVSGRDKTGDLVDCSAVLPSGGVKNQTLEQIIYSLVKPYGIKISSNVDTGDKFTRFAVQQGESVFEAIDRACRLRGVLPTADGAGGIVLTQIGSGRATTNLIEGKNVKLFKHYSSLTGRFSSYKVLGQSGSSDSFFGSKACQVSAKTTDETVTRHRPLIIVAEGEVTSTTAKRRAEWERAVRIGKSRTITAVVPGWLQESGEPWRPNMQVGVQCPSLHLPSLTTLLIGAVEYTYGESEGEIATLTLTRPDAYLPEQLKEKKDKGKTNPFGGMKK